jgi:hypothetical protein
VNSGYLRDVAPILLRSSAKPDIYPNWAFQEHYLKRQTARQSSDWMMLKPGNICANCHRLSKICTPTSRYNIRISNDLGDWHTVCL